MPETPEMPAHVAALIKATAILRGMPEEDQRLVRETVSRLTAAFNAEGEARHQMLALELFRHQVIASYMEAQGAAKVMAN